MRPKDIMEHPIQTALCILAGEYVLAYQLAKVTSHLAGIGITYLIDEDAGKRAWNEYIEPLTSTIDAFIKEELSVRDCIKGVATFGTAMVAQHKMLRGLGSLYNSTKVKAIEFANKNPLISPQEYMATPEGLIFKATSDAKKIIFKYETLNQGSSLNLSNIAFDQSILYASTKEKLIHFFEKTEHGFGSLLKKFDGNQKRIITEIMQKLVEHKGMPTSGKFTDIAVNISNETVCVRGFVDSGIIKIGTMFVPGFKK